MAEALLDRRAKLKRFVRPRIITGYTDMFCAVTGFVEAIGRIILLAV